MPVTWIPLAGLSVSRLPEFGSGSGAYVLRKRASGEWVYIGSTNCLRRRLLGNYLGGVGGATTKRVNGHLFDEGDIGDTEVSVHPAEDYLQREESLKAEYKATHGGRLPVWTRR